MEKEKEKIEPTGNESDDGAQESSLQETVEGKIEELIKQTPEEEPITMNDVTSLLDDKLSKLEEHIAARFVQMGGVINDGGKEPDKPLNTMEYKPLTELDYDMKGF